MSCTAGYKRHRFVDHKGIGRATCVRCHAPNPNWKKLNGSADRVLLLVKPARRPSWWPQEQGKAAWATVNWDGEYIVGYSIGQHVDRVMAAREAKAAIRAWREDNDYRCWRFKIEPLPAS